MTRVEALAAIERLMRAGAGGAVFTPNVDHVVRAERDPDFRAAYAAADVVLADGMPLVWASRLAGAPLPERVAGSDLVVPLAHRASQIGCRLFLLGGAPGDAEKAAAVLERRGVRIAGVAAPRVELEEAARAANRALAERVRASGARLVYVALGAPKQEIWIHRHRALVGQAVMVGVGASLAFVAGTVPRAPAWMSRAGAEWVHRLATNPGRLWRRYLVDDLGFAAILWRMLAERTRTRKAGSA